MLFKSSQTLYQVSLSPSPWTLAFLLAFLLFNIVLSYVCWLWPRVSFICRLWLRGKWVEKGGLLAHISA